MQQCGYGAIMPINFHKLSNSNKARSILQAVCKIVSVQVECIVRLIF